MHWCIWLYVRLYVEKSFQYTTNFLVNMGLSCFTLQSQSPLCHYQIVCGLGWSHFSKRYSCLRVQKESSWEPLDFQPQTLDRYIFLTHWGRVTHICVGRLTIIGSDNGLSPGRCQAIIWTIAGILLIWPLGTNFSEILIGILTFSFKKMRLKVSSAKRRPFCFGLGELSCIDCH